MLRIVFILVVFTGLLAACSQRPNVPSDFQSREVNGRGYRVYVPPNLDPNKKLPVMLYLHGSGARGDDNIAQVDGFRWAIEPIKDRVEFIVVLPQCRNNTFWAATDMADYSLAALDQTVKEFDGDAQRLYLVGFSLGGYGVWQIGGAFPGKFAALVPIAGGVVGKDPINPSDRAAVIPSVGEMLDSPEPYKAVAEGVGKTPVWVFHGTNDDAVPADFARRIVKAMSVAGHGNNVTYTEYRDDGHQIFGKALTEPGLLEWLTEQKLRRP